MRIGPGGSVGQGSWGRACMSLRWEEKAVQRRGNEVTSCRQHETEDRAGGARRRRCDGVLLPPCIHCSTVVPERASASGASAALRVAVACLWLVRGEVPGCTTGNRGRGMQAEATHSRLPRRALGRTRETKEGGRWGRSATPRRAGPAVAARRVLSLT